MSRTPHILTAERTLKLDLKGIKLIEASAGTGKTYTISNLYCRFIIEGYALQNILLVTFTNAATDELKQRIRLRLKTVLKIFSNSNDNSLNDEFLMALLKDFNVKDENEQQLIINRLILAMRSFDEAAIHTINGFCQRMLSDYAFNSAQHYELNLIQNDKELWQSAIKDWWRQTSYTLSPSHYSLYMKAVKSLKEITYNSSELRSDSKRVILPNNIESIDALYQQWDELNATIVKIKSLWQEQKQGIKQFFDDNPIFNKARIHGVDKIEGHYDDLDAYLSAGNFNDLPKCFELICLSKIKSNVLKAHIEKLSFFDDSLFHLADYVLSEYAQVIKHFSASAIINAHDFAVEETVKAKLKQQNLSFDDQLRYLNQALESSTDLAKNIHQQFPIALIDEFQDTNPIQYSIFQHIYQPQNDKSLIMIGDPKQAIYSFRGGDIFTYLSAKHHAGDQLYSLNANYRSTLQLIKAVNHLFTQRDDAFIYSDDMPYDAVVAGFDNQAQLIRYDKTQTALSLWRLADDHSTTSAADNINQHVANEISTLINEGLDQKALINNAPVKAADIAILVRNNFEGKEVADALKQRGINSINIGKDKVLQSDAAHGLLALLNGIDQVDNLQAVRNMLASRLFMHTPDTINNIVNNESNWLEWVSKVNQLHTLWLHDGFMSMFYSMIRILNVTQAMMRLSDSERQITNLLHCAEIIQNQSKSLATPQALCAWLQHNINHPELSSDEDELRLESDTQLVKIVTVHKSKGLEYPIVFVPFLWNCKPKSEKASFFQYHNEQNLSVVDFALDDSNKPSINADKERLAEDMRLLYVALTRAKSKVYLVTGQVSRSKSNYSALSFLCHHHQTAQDLNIKRADIKAYLNKHDAYADLVNISKNSEETIDVTLLDLEPTMVQCNAIQETSQQLSPSHFKGQINEHWIISSFSRMTRDVHQVAHGGHTKATQDDIFNFKRGGDAGTFLHHILELLDFSGDIKQQTIELFNRFAPRYYLESESNQETVCQWMQEIVQTSLNDKGFSLSHLSPNKRLDELEFDFSLNGVDIKALNQFLSHRTGQDGSQLNIHNFKGLMTGFIDLVFEHEGQYYISDYKSNFLGNQLVDYSPDKLHQAIIDRRYDLQYLLYSLALHRYLRYRLSDYNYDQHFGGVYYLFLRAMRKNTGKQFGVFFDKPSFEEIDTLDQVIFKPVTDDA